MQDRVDAIFHRKLREKLEKLLQGSCETVATGKLSDHATYKDCCGYIRGLRDALSIAEEVAQKLQGD